MIIISDILESEKKEYLLEFDSFKQNKYVEGLYTTATMIQTLLLTEPGTYPTNSELGVGIESYEMEFADEKTIMELTSKINYQIKKFITDVNIIDIVVEKLPNQLGVQNILGVMVKLYDSNFETKNIILLTGQSIQTQKTISKIVI